MRPLLILTVCGFLLVPVPAKANVVGDIVKVLVALIQGFFGYVDEKTEKKQEEMKVRSPSKCHKAIAEAEKRKRSNLDFKDDDQD